MAKLLHVILATYLLVLPGIPGQGMHVFTGVKVMVAHFHEHELEHEHEHNHEDTDHGIDFFEFLYLHYADESHKDSEGHEDLPFHHNHQDGVVTYFVAPTSSLVPQPAAAVPATQAHSFFESRLLSPLVYSFWQPPKF